MDVIKRWKRTLPTIGGLVVVSACATVTPSVEQLNAVLWVQSSVEYEATARQAFRLADVRLADALDDPSWTAALEQGEAFTGLLPAVILDVDETVLDNSPFQARLIRDGREFESEAWSAWTAEARARAIPGALGFTRRADSLGVRVFYVTNRDYTDEEATRRNLEQLGFPLDEDADVLLTRGERPEWGSDKASRRAHVARTHRVLLVIGDDLNDFVSGARETREARLALARRHEEAWGLRWIVLPNPTYGSWESTLYDFARTLSADERRRRKTDSLDTRPPVEGEEPL
jgi:acid phosphatase